MNIYKYFIITSNNYKVDDVRSFFIIEESKLQNYSLVREDHNKLKYAHRVLSVYNDVFNIIEKSIK